MATPSKPEAEPQIQSTPVDTEAQIRRTSADGDVVEKPADDAIPDQEAQLGVQKIEAITLSWSKLGLAIMLIKYVSLQPSFS